MAFQFTGTFTTGQLLKLYEFAKWQEQDILKRITFLQLRLSINGIINVSYGPDNHPVSITTSDPNSYAARLLDAYVLMGGNPKQELLLRNKSDPVYLTTGAPFSFDDDELTEGYSNILSNGMRLKEGHIFDSVVGIQTEKLKRWQRGPTKGKREQLEYKIYKCLDYSDQLEEEIALLEMMTNASDPTQSVDAKYAAVVAAYTTPGVATVVQNDADLFGLNIGKIIDPLSPSDVRQAPEIGGRF